VRVNSYGEKQAPQALFLAFWSLTYFHYSIILVNNASGGTSTFESALKFECVTSVLEFALVNVVVVAINFGFLLG